VNIATEIDEASFGSDKKCSSSPLDFAGATDYLPRSIDVYYGEASSVNSRQAGRARHPML
jgi:hypothetical protein